MPRSSGPSQHRAVPDGRCRPSAKLSVAEGGRMVSGVLYEVVRHLGDAELWRYDIWTLATGYDMD